MLFLIRALLAKDELCPSPRACPKADTLRCINCGYQWRARDIDWPEPCPHCRDERYARERCSGCNVTRLEDYLSKSRYGSVVARAADLNFALDAGFHITLDDVTIQEFEALKVLRREAAILQARRFEQQQRPAPTGLEPRVIGPSPHASA